MGLFLRANNLNTTKEPDVHKRGLFQRSLDFSTPEDLTDQKAIITSPAIIEVIEETEEFSDNQELKLDEIEIYEESDFSSNDEPLVQIPKNPAEQKEKVPNSPSLDSNLTNNTFPDYSISEIDDFKDELSHQLIRSLEKGKAFFLVKISIKTITGFVNKSVPLNELLKVFQHLMIDMGKTYLFGTHHVILVINKMYKPDPVIFVHQLRSAIKRNFIELENLNDLEFNPMVRVFPEHGKTAQKLIDGLFD